MSFSLLSFSTIDPALTIAQQMTLNPTEEDIQMIRNELKLDSPMHIQYFSWLSGVLSGDFGDSYINRKPVVENLKTVFPNTFRIAIGSFVLIILSVTMLSVISVLNKDRFLDYIIRFVTIIGICIPVFWFGFILLTLFAVKYPIFDVVPNISKVGYVAYVLPIFTLSFSYTCGGVRMFRGLLLAEYSANYTTYLRARGLSKGQILIGHNLKNALPPMITWFATCAANLLGGTAIIESVFSMKVVGSSLIDAINAGDIPTISFIVMVIATSFVLLNLLADMINIYISPRYIGNTGGEQNA